MMNLAGRSRELLASKYGTVVILLAIILGLYNTLSVRDVRRASKDARGGGEKVEVAFPVKRIFDNLDAVEKYAAVAITLLVSYDVLRSFAEQMGNRRNWHGYHIVSKAIWLVVFECFRYPVDNVVAHQRSHGRDILSTCSDMLAENGWRTLYQGIEWRFIIALITGVCKRYGDELSGSGKKRDALSMYTAHGVASATLAIEYAMMISPHGAYARFMKDPMSVFDGSLFLDISNRLQYDLFQQILEWADINDWKKTISFDIIFFTLKNVISLPLSTLWRYRFEEGTYLKAAVVARRNGITHLWQGWQAWLVRSLALEVCHRVKIVPPSSSPYLVAAVVKASAVKDAAT